MDIIKLKDVNKIFVKGNKVLNKINLCIKEGERVALIGPSGSGKSTLIRIIGGFEKIDKGLDSKVEIMGVDRQRDGKLLPESKKINSEIGIIFQQFNLVGRLKLLTNVLIGRLNKTSNLNSFFYVFDKKDKLIALEALDNVGMLEFAHQRASTLSGGQQQRGAIARVLAQEAKIVLADEPIASLDPASSERVMKNLIKLNEKHKKTLLVSLHQFSVAKKMFDRIIAMKKGEIVYDGSPKDIKKKDLIEIYGVYDADEMLT
ncbi:MAG: phosphonate transport system ATP-binding protein [Deferribacteres bacterium]|jgi:phosphonate transport system ATP-binding protein|nr:phnC [Deferribacteraceae bacterium]MDK2793242.1 phosphonate transport system ATP-binding protein [Deferribacteres bacterium]